MTLLDGAVAAPALGEETVAPGEDAIIERLTAVHRAIQEMSDRRRSPVPRGQHPKNHGAVAAEFIVRDDVPAACRHGLLREPRRYPAWVRFSSGGQYDDRRKDVHGMAVKVLDIAGESALGGPAVSQDFIMIDIPAFFVRNLADYIPFFEDFRRLKTPGLSLAKIATVLKVQLSRNYKFRMLRAGLTHAANPLALRYWSTVPYRLGPWAIKFAARPDPAVALAAAPPPGRDRLRQALAAHLAGREARFDFLVQRQTDAVTMPVEDPTIAWDERVSPYVPVATVRIPPQRFDTPEQMTFCEHLTFTPWHALAEHRPLGAINRSRRRIYEAIAARRHELNGVPLTEPAPPRL